MTVEEQKNTPVTHVRVRIPKGMKVSDVVSRLEISFEEIEPTGEEIGPNFCCVDAVIVSPVSTVHNR
jgi:hypothetical protein